MKRIVSLSGGKDSTAMLLLLLDMDISIDYVVFVDTTKEFPEIYDNVSKLEKYISPIPLIRLRFNYDSYLPKYGFPFLRSRWCTGFKRDLMRSFATSLRDDYIMYIGIAYDESHRVRFKKHLVYPLVQFKITESQALKICYSHGFDFSGLYNIVDRTGCYCCPFSVKRLYSVYRHYHELFEDIKRMEDISRNKFTPDCSIYDYERKFSKIIPLPLDNIFL